MKREHEYLLKRFASVLRGIALGKPQTTTIEENVAHCLSRKDLIEIIKKCFDGTIPKEHNLIEMEKPELLGLVKNEMIIISYMTEKWSKEPVKTPEKSTPQTIDKKIEDKKQTSSGKKN